MTLRGLIVAALLITGCTPTTYDESAVSSAPTTPPPTNPLSTDPADALPLMLDEVADLARRVVESDDDDAAATRIEAIWTAIEPTVRAEHPELVSGFDFVVRRCRAAADRNRPADADRAFRNLQSLVEAYLDL